VQPRDRRGLILEAAEVQDLHAQSLRELRQTHVRGGGCLGGRLLAHRIDEVAADPVRLTDHHRPHPLVLVAIGERLQPIRPPQPLERADDVVAAELLLARELDRVAQRVERLDGASVGIRLWRARAIDLEEQHPGHVDLDESIGRRRVELLLVALEIDLGHARHVTRSPSGTCACRPP
jgi:hypothetical protein